MEMLHAYYSPSLAIGSGTVIYAREDGTEVEVTEVSSRERPSRVKDEVYLGIVTRSVRKGQTGRLESELMRLDHHLQEMRGYHRGLTGPNGRSIYDDLGVKI